MSNNPTFFQSFKTAFKTFQCPLCGSTEYNLNENTTIEEDIIKQNDKFGIAKRNIHITSAKLEIIYLDAKKQLNPPSYIVLHCPCLNYRAYFAWESPIGKTSESVIGIRSYETTATNIHLLKEEFEQDPYSITISETMRTTILFKNARKMYDMEYRPIKDQETLNNIIRKMRIYNMFG